MDKSNELRSQWKHIEEQLRSIYVALNFRIGMEAERLFYELLDANEFGLAYDQLCDELKEAKKPISAAVYDSIRSVGLEMHYEPAIWEPLQFFVQQVRKEPMAGKASSLISFWIEGTDPHGPIGFGVTAWSVDDAIALIQSAGYSIEPRLAVIQANVQPHQVDSVGVDIPKYAGPSTFRGVWYPCLNIGWGASGEH